ncbi:ABC transporter ATP-binding protein [Mesorhizobium sp. RMAD-H1]|uniref:ABC transporter ATP-binding protein n=1 Tax=Mesorhizobium sp. RMAD-H1 TaxID=2587065 RepID=UPI0016128196|nr:ABC transporter ATP-binding protein [Mesorhizobium sp. RMAD-H1]MBB2973161.1 spermidine/putrescine ABC transporter ATP-binding subunit [Mesorhizobium sp. RMAD-H1]
MASIEVRNLTRAFGGHKALDDVSVRFEDGGFYALLGPSGSGKTTLLRMIAGFDFPNSGRIEMDGESVERVPLEKRQIGMMFQNYALFPNMTVAGNIAFGLEMRGLPKAEIREKVRAALNLVKLDALGERKPHQLSGGQRQRVALARAFVINPRVLLLDEPLGALDKALRVDMQAELKRIQREIGITTIFVTHDQEEALTMADRIGILRDGRLVEEGEPEEIYNHPRTLFAATFLGDANILSGTWSGDAMVMTDGTRILVSGAEKHRPGEPMQCAIRPERMHLGKGTPTSSENTLAGRVVRKMFSGVSSTFHVETSGREIRVVVPNSSGTRFGSGDQVTVTWSAQNTFPVA